MSCPKKRLSKRTQNPLLCTTSCDKLFRRYTSTEISEQKSEGSKNDSLKQELWDILRYNRELLDEYVLTEVPQEKIERWMIRKASLKTEKEEVPSSLSDWKFCVHSDKRKMLNNLLPAIESGDKSQLLLGLSYIIQSATKADHFHVYITTSKKTLVPVLAEEDEDYGGEYKIQKEDTVVGYVAATGQVIITNTLKRDSRFPNGIAFKDSFSQASSSLLVVPILTLDNQVIGIIELIRLAGRLQFNLEEMEIIESYMTWISIAFNYSSTECVSLKNTQKLNSSLLEIFKLAVNKQTDVDIDQILQAISDQALSLFQADRSSVFLVDKPRGELYARVFGMPPDEMKYIEKVKESSLEMDIRQKRSFAFKHSTEGVSYRGKPIRFPVSDGIAGYVARTGEVLLCEDVGDDARFNRCIDMMTGYKTRSILCAPLKIKEK